MIIMDHQRRTRAIEEVQAAESTGQRLLDEAAKHKEKAIRDAEEMARKILEDAKTASDALGEEMLKKADGELAHLRKKRMEDASKDAARLRKVKPSTAKLERLADQAIKELMG